MNQHGDDDEIDREKEEKRLWNPWKNRPLYRGMKGQKEGNGPGGQTEGNQRQTGVYSTGPLLTTTNYRKWRRRRAVTRTRTRQCGCETDSIESIPQRDKRRGDILMF